MKTTPWMLIGGAGALLLGALALTPAPPAPGPGPKPAPAPGPNPGPAPAPAPKAAKLLIVTQPSCAHCDRLKRDWPQGFPVPHEWVQNSRDVAQRYRVEGVPTLIAVDAQGNEVGRQLGYLPPDELRRWLGAEEG